MVNWFYRQLEEDSQNNNYKGGENMKISEQKLNEIKSYLIEKIFRNPDIMFSDEMIENDIPEIICGLFEYLHISITGEPYDYMFHWANKCGSWVETDFFDKIIEDRMKQKGDE